MHWTEYVSSIGVMIIAAIAALIAFRQSQIARNKLKLDLFDKRMEVYSAVREALGCITRQGNLTQEQQLEYLQGIRTARWLFGQEIFTYLDETLWRKIVDLEFQGKMSEGSADPERVKHIQARTETFKWLVSQYKEFDALVAKYLTLRH